MKNLFSLFLCLLTFLSVQGAPIDASSARRIAEEWWGKNLLGGKKVSFEPLKMQSFPQAYLFNHEAEFLLVAKDDTVAEILGYGSRDKAGQMPVALRAMLHQTLETKSYPPMGAKWEIVEPLLTTVRHQSAPYNDFCPYFQATNGTLSENRCVVGCVATAMEQILTYYRREYVLLDTLKGWKTPNYIIADILPGERMDTRLIRNNYEDGKSSAESIEAVARLSYDLGVACHMKWGVSESAASSYKLVEPLRRAFGLKYVHHLDSYKYAPVAYWNCLAAEIMARRPVYYAGSVMRTGGHAFVLDGLDANGLFHVNWGYGGSYDGYFRLDVLAHPQPEADRQTEAVESGFFCNQEAIVVCPDSVTDVSVPDTLHRTGREVCIESIRFGETPVKGCHTPVYLVVQNTDKQALTTSFAFLQNEPSDTSLCEQADWLALTGRTLQAGERDTLCVHLKFTKSGTLWLSVTPDGEQILQTIPVEVGEGGTDQIESLLPELSFLDERTLEVHQFLSNPSETERAAQYFVYDLKDEQNQTDGQVEHFIYLPPQADTIDVVRFCDLVPGRTYTLHLRRRWPIVQSVRFTVPDATGIGTVENQPCTEVVEWYRLDGKRVVAPQQPGVYLRKQGKLIKKYIVARRP